MAKKLERLEIVYVPIEELCPNDYNPNRQSDHDFEMLIRSIEEDGFTTPIYVTPQNVIIDGEHRWRAAQVVGLTELPVVYGERDDAQARISTIRHNRARGSHDIELEAEVLRDLQRLGVLDEAQEALMLDDIELDRLINDIAAPDALADEDFSEAWVPESFNDEESELIRTGGQTTKGKTKHGSHGEETVIAMTAEAIEQQRRREELIKRARTEEERQKIRAESRNYRVSLIYSGDEAETVKKVLGDRQAEMLLRLCKKHLKEVS